MSNNAITTNHALAPNGKMTGYGTNEINWEADLHDSDTSSPEPAPPKIQGVVIGELVGQDADGRPLVDFVDNLSDEPVVAKSLAPFEKPDIGRQAALMFEGGNLQRPILMGLVHESPATPNEAPRELTSPLNVSADGKQVVLQAEKEIVLKCGKASITLTRAGKILLRGAYLLSRSSGANRIKGGSVQIN